MTTTVQPAVGWTAQPVAEVVYLPLHEIHESPLNPRTHYDAEALQQLAESLQASGQLESALVRPRPAGGYELAAGHRRYRAAKLAGLAVLKAEVRPMANPEFVEVLNVSNLQRDDLHPLEEAQGFRTLMETAGYDIPRIAARLGKSTRYVYDRLKLLQLVPEAKQLFLQDAFTAGHAILLARLRPEDQDRAIASHRSGNGHIGGLFEPERFDQGELELEDTRKAISVREFAHWIDDHVRFRPESEDLPNLFPETGEALTAAQEAGLKVVHITRDYLVDAEARDPERRTYGGGAWRRADGVKAGPEHRYDGRKPGKPATCEHAVLGVVVAGPGRGEAFPVCIAKKICTIHWGSEIKAAAQVAKALEGGASRAETERAGFEREKARHRQERDQAEAERKRWQRAAPRLCELVAEHLKGAATGPTSPTGRFLVQCIRPPNKKDPKAPGVGTTAEALVRYLAYCALMGELQDTWRAAEEWPALLKPFGIDAVKVLNEVAPVAKPAKAAKAAPKKKKARR